MNFQQNTPVAPRFDVNAPDLYIPVMAFITYVLVAGLALGTQNRYLKLKKNKQKYIWLDSSVAHHSSNVFTEILN